jgi:dTDP-4-amino-4,6-dideoxygalactose transaminase
LIADAAQSFGGSINGNKVGTHADITTTSFFPSKPLGCYGDGGAIFTDDDDTADIVRSIRAHGGSNQGKYDNVRVGMNARLDTIQAAVLIEKLKIFPDELHSRQLIAERYAVSLSEVVTIPTVPDGFLSAWAQYTIATEQRDKLCEYLNERGIPTQIYYPKPLHMQLPYKGSQAVSGELPVTDRLSKSLMSLPMHPYLDAEIQDRITQCIVTFFEENTRVSK